MTARGKRSTAAWVVRTAVIAGGALCTVMVGKAEAGCNDGACGRVDWTEITEMDEGAPAAAKLHGAYSWEASPDGWATHPVAGTVLGYYWLTCLAPGGTNAVCRGQLAAELAKAGTDTTMTFNGGYFDPDAGAVIRPAGLFVEGQPGSPAVLSELLLGGSPLNPEVCRSALALPRNNGDASVPDAAGGAGGGPASDASTGGASGGGPASDASTGGVFGGGPALGDDAGCSASGRSSSAHFGFVAFVFLAAALEVARRRRN